MSRRFRLNICENFRPEILALQGEPAFADLDVTFFPSHCGQPPMTLEDLTGDSVDSKDEPYSASIGSACMAHLKSDSEVNAGTEIHYLEQCFSLFIPAELADYLLLSGVYLCTPGWLADWRSHMKEYGDDQTIIRQLFGESVSKIVLLDTGTDPNSVGHLPDFAEYLDLPFETLPVGLDHFRLKIHNLLLQQQNRKPLKEELSSDPPVQQPMADYAMALELLSELPRFETEEAVIDRIEYVFSMLFAPIEYYLLTISNGKAEKLRSCNSSQTNEEVIARLMKIEPSFGFTPGGAGFFFKIGDRDHTTAIIEITSCTHSESIQQYCNISLSIRGIFDLAIANARTFTTNLETTRQLQEALENVKVLRGLIPICSFCKQIRSDQGAWQAVEQYVSAHSEAVFSHGICPECLHEHFPEYED